MRSNLQFDFNQSDGVVWMVNYGTDADSDKVTIPPHKADIHSPVKFTHQLITTIIQYFLKSYLINVNAIEIVCHGKFPVNIMIEFCIREWMGEF